MNIISTVSEDNAGEVGYAFIRLTPELAKEYLDLRENCKTVLSLHGIYGVDFFEVTPTLHYKSDEPFMEEFEESASWEEAPKDWTPKDGSEMSTSVIVMTVKPTGIIWRFYSKHSCEVFETCEIDWGTIRAVATEGTKSKKKA